MMRLRLSPWRLMKSQDKDALIARLSEAIISPQYPTAKGVCRD